jgi:hypothetical protein
VPVCGPKSKSKHDSASFKHVVSGYRDVSCYLAGQPKGHLVTKLENNLKFSILLLIFLILR